MQRVATVAVCLSIGLLGAAAQAQTPDGTVSLPTAFVDTTYPSQGSSVTVCSSACTYSDLQAAVNAVQPGTTIMVDPSFPFSGTLTLPAKANTGARVVIRSSS